MARSRYFALCFLITRMFMFLLICLDSTKPAVGYICCYVTAFYLCQVHVLI